MTLVEYRQESGVGIISINRPEKLNALSQAMMDEISSALDRAEADDGIRAITLFGTSRAFSAGADIGEQDGTTDIFKSRTYQKSFMNWFHRFELLEKPIIAGVHGYCLGGGFEMALASDVIVATPEAQFGLPEVKIGLVPGFAMVRLPELVGRHKAKQLVFTGARIDGTEAYRLGIANELVEYSNLHERVLALAGSITEQAPLAVRFLKSVINRGLTRQDLMWAWEAELQLFASRDAVEGRAAFAERRQPMFKGE